MAVQRISGYAYPYTDVLASAVEAYATAQRLDASKKQMEAMDKETQRADERHGWAREDAEAQRSARSRAAAMEAPLDEAVADAESQRQLERAKRAEATAGVLTPEQVAAQRERTVRADEMKLEQAGATLESTRATTANTRDLTRDRQDARNRTSAEDAAKVRRDALRATYLTLDPRRPSGERFNDPEYRKAAVKLQRFISTPGASFNVTTAGPEVMDTVNRMLAEEVNKGRGEPRQDGSVIERKKITRVDVLTHHPATGAKFPEPMLAVQLAVTARRPGEAAPYTYSAPATEGRSAREDDANVKLIPASVAKDRIAKEAGMSAGLSSMEKDGGNVQELMETTAREYIAAGGDPADLGIKVGAESDKADTVEIKTRDASGKEIIATYRTVNGTPVGEPIAIGGRWNPNSGFLPPMGITGYQLPGAAGLEATSDDAPDIEALTAKVMGGEP